MDDRDALRRRRLRRPDPGPGGVAFGLTYGRPEPSMEAVPGAPAIKNATLTVTVDYESGAPLA